MSLIGNKTQMALIDAFVADLEKFLGVGRQVVSFEELWDRTSPPEAKGASFRDYMNHVRRRFNSVPGLWCKS